MWSQDFMDLKNCFGLMKGVQIKKTLLHNEKTGEFHENKNILVWKVDVMDWIWSDQSEIQSRLDKMKTIDF